ncbi:glutamate receptor 4-like [Fopius arisanus]|uniref:Glutamate receptor 4-like n=1 Tax=Fopius arisanus TaxID=64838 RepID=A0A9R1TXA0_9HYME|nr:PREDICTED: glutamate receptor 4-like [Fopius arisanus]
MRLLYISICMSALMISFTYSASLTSVLAVSKLPFNSLKQFAQAGTYGLIAVDDSEEYDLLKFSEDPVLQQMSKLLIPKALLPWSYVEGFHQICEEQVAFYAHYATSMRYPEREMPCEMHSIKTGYVQLSGIITPRGSEFTHAINYYLQRFKQNGILQRLENIYIVVEYTPEPVLLSANLRGVAPILIILISGVIVASLIFTVEWIFYYFRYIRYKSRQTPFTL